MLVISFRGTRSEMSTIYIPLTPEPCETLDGPEANAIVFPSGDQLGSPVTELLRFEICTGWVPSASLIHISRKPPRSDRNAICFPSGEYAGFSCAHVEEMSFAAADSGCNKSFRQMLRWKEYVAYASLSPLGETVGQTALCPSGIRRSEPSASVSSYSSKSAPSR